MALPETLPSAQETAFPTYSPQPLQLPGPYDTPLRAPTPTPPVGFPLQLPSPEPAGPVPLYVAPPATMHGLDLPDLRIVARAIDRGVIQPIQGYGAAAAGLAAGAAGLGAEALPYLVPFVI